MLYEFVMPFSLKEKKSYTNFFTPKELNTIKINYKKPRLPCR